MKSLSFLAVLLAVLPSLLNAGTTHIVYVGSNGLNFSPSELTASPGDTIEFQFFPHNFSVVQASYGYPCIPSQASTDVPGFFSGFYYVNFASDPPTWFVTVNDTNPIFYYSGSPGSCQQGMVGVINPTETYSFNNQLAYAENATIEYVPGENPPKQTLSSTVIRTTTASGSDFHPTALTSSLAEATITSTNLGSASTSTQGVYPTTATILDAQSGSPLSTSKIIAICIAGVAVTLFIVWCSFSRLFERRRARKLKQAEMTEPSNDPYRLPSPLFSNPSTPLGFRLAERGASRLSGQTQFSGQTFTGRIGSSDTGTSENKNLPDEKTEVRTTTVSVPTS